MSSASSSIVSLGAALAPKNGPDEGSSGVGVALADEPDEVASECNSLCLAPMALSLLDDELANWPGCGSRAPPAPLIELSECDCCSALAGKLAGAKAAVELATCC